MTVKEALKITISTLSSISVPVALMGQIGEPIATAVGNLNACIEAMDREEEKNGNADAE